MGATRVSRVCKTCNEGWLNAMEQECFPIVEQIIRGDLNILLPEHQKKLATVATSMAMVGEWLNHAYVTTSHEERQLFRVTLEPPPMWFVYIGHNVVPFGDAAFLSDGAARSFKPGVKGERQYASFTLIMGPVLIHILVLNAGTVLDVDLYARTLGLSAIHPPMDWINFGLMPRLDADDVARIRSYAGMSFKRAREGR